MLFAKQKYRQTQNKHMDTRGEGGRMNRDWD